MKLGGDQGGGGKSFPKAPPGLVVAVCAAIYDIGVQTKEWQGETKQSRQVAIVWELDKQDPEGRPFTMVDAMANSTHKKARLYSIITALTGTALEEFEELDTEMVIGKSAMLLIAESDKGNPYIERRDPLQDPGRAIDIRGSYGPDDEIHGLVAWHMKRAEDGTVMEGQGIMPEPRKPMASREAKGGVDSKEPDYGEIPF